eukprot:m.16744 g.16744  ORF g.16744 m.16744 type:complete len:257 (+) comp5779_c0_seq1:161-931(+)
MSEKAVASAERKATKIIQDHVPGIDEHEAGALACSAVSQFIEGENEDEIVEELVNMLPTMNIGDIDDVEQAAADIVHDMLHNGTCLDPMLQKTDNVIFDNETRGMALLAEDNDWHSCEIVADDGGEKLLVNFLEYSAQREIDRESFVPDIDDDDDEESEEIGACSICQRENKLTKHHMIPRSEHKRFQKRGFTLAFLRGPENITECCRQCHSMVHRLANNSQLAEKYDTVDKIRAHPKMKAWATYISSHSVNRRAR